MSLFDPLPGPDDAHFAGDDYDPAMDDERLRGQMGRVYRAMADGQWRTVDQIHSMTGDPPASILAQLGHLRKERFGSYLVEKRSVGDRTRGLYEYRVGAKGEGTPRTRQAVTSDQEKALRAADALFMFVRHGQHCSYSTWGGRCDCGLEPARALYRAARSETR